MAQLTGRASERGSVAVRVLLIIIGAVLIVFGAIMSIAVVAITFDGDPTILILLPGTLAALVGGIYIIIKQASSKKDETRRAEADERSHEQSERVVSSVPIANSPAPSATGGSAAGSAGADDATEDVARLVFRSSDLFATLRDLVRHASFANSDKRHLASMLDAAGVMYWQDAPACEGGRLSRNTHFWVRMPLDGLTDEQYDTLISAEAALGVNQDLPSLNTLPLTDPAVLNGCLKLMHDMCDQRIEQGSLTKEGMRVCYHDENATGHGDWLVRSTICNAAECLRTPFRVTYDLHVNIDEGLVVIELEVVRPRCFAIFTPDRTAQANYARAYALRLSALMAAHAREASDLVRRVVVNCHEHGSTQTILSLDFTPEMLRSLLKVAKKSALDEGFPEDRCIRAVLDGGAWLSPVEPFVSIDAPEAVPARARIFPELDERTASEDVQRTCGAKRICDLGINENAARVAAWSDIHEKLGSTTEAAVSALVSARDSATDITVAEACNRTMQALIDGKAELDNLDALSSIFVDGSALDRAVARAVDLLDDTDGHEDPESALQVLEAALAPIEDMGVYLDDNSCVYRYFGSVSERVHYNLAADDGGREVRLVPDAYFNAHSNASIALGMLGRNDEALAHADVCRRLAPMSTYATMRKVRVLEAQSRIYEAADLIISALEHAVTPRDAAICHYRLAYMEWKLGREDLAAACYVRSMTWDTEMSGQAREELDDLIQSIPSLERPTEEQADALLAREGIPLGCVRTDGERTLASAVACMDDDALISARPLMAVLFGMNSDDVVMGVYRSLNVSV